MIEAELVPKFKAFLQKIRSSSTMTELSHDKIKSKNNLIHSVVAKGYKLILKNQDIRYIRKALVKVFEYQEK